jgi:Tfp pilus assembly protein PilO
MNYSGMYTNTEIVNQLLLQKGSVSAMKGILKLKTKKLVKIITIVMICIVVVIVGYTLYGKYQLSKIPALSFKEALEYTTKENKNAVITVKLPRTTNERTRMS